MLSYSLLGAHSGALQNAAAVIRKREKRDRDSIRLLRALKVYYDGRKSGGVPGQHVSHTLNSTMSIVDVCNQFIKRTLPATASRDTTGRRQRLVVQQHHPQFAVAEPPVASVSSRGKSASPPFEANTKQLQTLNLS